MVGSIYIFNIFARSFSNNDTCSLPSFHKGQTTCKYISKFDRLKTAFIATALLQSAPAYACNTFHLQTNDFFSAKTPFPNTEDHSNLTPTIDTRLSNVGQDTITLWPGQNAGIDISSASLVSSPATEIDITPVTTTELNRQLDPAASGNEPSPAELAMLLKLPDRLPTPVVDNIDMSRGLGSIFSDLSTLQNQIVGMQKPAFTALFGYSNQSDSLDIRQEAVAANLYLNGGLTRIGPSVQAINYSPASGYKINQYIAGFTGRQQIGNFFSLTGESYFNNIVSHGINYDKLTYDVYLTYKPSDYFRFDLDSNRRLFDNIISMQIGARAQSYGGSVDYLPNSMTKLTTRLAYSTFNDGNRRRTEEIEGLWRVKGAPIIELGIRGTNFHYTQLLNDGYFNPRNYAAGEAVFHINGPIAERLNADFAGSGGIENSSPGGTKPLYKGSLKLSYKINERWSVDSNASYFSSRTSNSTGFARATGLIGLSYHL